MCGRYYVDDETAKEIVKIVRNLDWREKPGPVGDIRPSQRAGVIRGQEEHLTVSQMNWGFPRFDDKGILINARAESALQRRTFRDSVRHRRCVIPAKGFYEWDKKKEKFAYEDQDSPVLFMAGCYNRFRDQDCFVILTTQANPSVLPVHDRMPLVLEPEELESWVLDDRATEALLHKTPALLRSSTEYEQMRLF
ncbi:MAG TPA: SOS response-associated peptidase [Candidatus Dorea gallistercoris]|uniref:Abasic site processing protein n=1 Tax=Candidatus Dorea gallistercoris TaxID=2838542 RepID=A0A9D1UEF3_9FIRM|nr:SOS response-associated peptidase [Candidatus Dorea gallistercoris]